MISSSSWVFNGAGFFSLPMATPSSSSSTLFMTKFKGSEEEEVEDDEEEDVEDEESESLNHIKIIINYFLYIKYIMIILNELYMMKVIN